MSDRIDFNSLLNPKWPLFGLALFPLLPLKISGLFAGLALIFSIVTFVISKKRQTPSKEMNVFFALFLALPSFYLLELLWAGDTAYVWSVLQRKMGLIIIPLAWYLALVGGVRLDLKRFLQVYVLGVVGIVLFTLLVLVIGGVDPVMYKSGGLAFSVRTQIEVISGLHPTYFGVAVGMAILICLDALYTNRWKIKPILVVSAATLLFTFLFVLAARMAIGATFIGLIMLTLVSQVHTAWKWSIGLGSVLLGITLVAVVPSMQERIFEMVEPGVNATSIRHGIYGCAISEARLYWLWGCGVEFLQTRLNGCYFFMFNGLVDPFKNLNTHNEYLNILLGRGIFALLLFLAPIVLMLKKANKKPLLLGFLAVFALVCLTENLLERQIGVFFYAYFSAALVFLNFQPTQQITLSDE